MVGVVKGRLVTSWWLGSRERRRGQSPHGPFKSIPQVTPLPKVSTPSQCFWGCSDPNLVGAPFSGLLLDIAFLFLGQICQSILRLAILFSEELFLD
jgi:hypothetical protein